MDNYGVIGNPIQHSLSPQIHLAFAKQTGEAIAYEKYFVEIADFETAIKEFQLKGFKGLNITLPFKERAAKLCDELSNSAKLANAVNTLLFKENGLIYGDNTDGIGLLRDITVNHAFALQNKSILVLGAGGAARGIIGPLVSAGPKSLSIANRTHKKAVQLAAEFSALLHFPLIAVPFKTLPQPFDCIVNATSMGLKQTAFPLSGNLIGVKCCCYDMVYNTPTAFLAWAKQHRAQLILDGFGMLVEQAAAAFYLWRGLMPDTKAVLQQDIIHFH